MNRKRRLLAIGKSDTDNKSNTEVVRIKIVEALKNEKYRLRTIDGISSETKLPPFVVLKALKSDERLAKTVKISPVRTKDGRALITTKARFSKEASVKEKFIDFFASRRVVIKYE